MLQYHKFRTEKTMGMNFYNMYFVGMCTSIVFFVLLKKHLFSQLTDGSVSDCIHHIQIFDKGYFYFILKQRMKDAFLILFGTILLGHKKVSKIGAVAFGVFTGVLLCLCFDAYAIRGMILWGAYHFPHYLCYVLALYLWGEMENGYSVSVTEIGYNKMYCLKKLMQYIIIFAILAIGILLEYYVNTLIMEKVIKIFDCE